MRTKEFLLSGAMLLLSADLAAWGAEGHRVIGRAAYELLDREAQQEVSSLLGNPLEEGLADSLSSACNWPDRIRNEDRWKHTSPLHYVNIPRHSREYDRERDCPEGLCVTEGISRYASQLGYEDLDRVKKWQAFAFVCHLVADLHQPLHAGFRDDRGANSVDIEYHGEEWNLHQFWDGVLVRERLHDEEHMVARLVAAGKAEAAMDWNIDDLKTWTEESHALAADRAYPDGRIIDEAFADRSWSISVERWERAAGRLAKILNAVFGENEVRP